LTTSLSSIVGSIGEFNRQRVSLRDFDRLDNQYDEESVGESVSNINNYDIEFHDVSFCYPNTDKYILNNVSIKIPYGEKLAIVGNNGAGKSTFIKLICKFYKPTIGKITIEALIFGKLATRNTVAFGCCISRLSEFFVHNK
jgi:ABC-type bacteriocin/lantibiotic exporter with double-glycine peptidase domain